MVKGSRVEKNDNIAIGTTLGNGTSNLLVQKCVDNLYFYLTAII